MRYVKLMTFCHEQMRLQGNLHNALTILQRGIMHKNNQIFPNRVNTDYEQLVFSLERQVCDQQYNLQEKYKYLNSIEEAIEPMDNLLCWLTLDQYRCRYLEQQQSIACLNEFHKKAFQKNVLLNLPFLQIEDDLFNTEDSELTHFDLEPAEESEPTVKPLSPEEHPDKRTILNRLAMIRFRQKRKDEKQALINEREGLMQENDFLMKENKTLMSFLPKNKTDLFATSEFTMFSGSSGSSQEKYEAASPCFFKGPYSDSRALDAKKGRAERYEQLNKIKNTWSPAQKAEAKRIRNAISSSDSRQRRKQFINDIVQENEQLKAEQVDLKRKNIHLKKLLDVPSNQESGVEEQVFLDSSQIAGYRA